MSPKHMKKKKKKKKRRHPIRQADKSAPDVAGPEWII
jgi:hypothetical protein